VATSRESRRYVVAYSPFAGAGIWLRQDSLRHILASHGYAPGTIAVNVTWMTLPPIHLPPVSPRPIVSVGHSTVI